MSVPPFKEDFFERVIDVKWDTEPEVFWLVGSGHFSYINGMGGTNACVYRSSDGKRWYGTQQYRPGGAGIGAFFGGCWMRKGLVKGADPVWMMCGGSSRTVASACAGSSTDGETFGDRVVFDERHLCEEVFPRASDIVMYAQPTMATFIHYDPYYSSNGQTWTPADYHGGETNLLSVRAAVAAAPAAFQADARAIGSSRSSIALHATGDPETEPLEKGLLMPQPPELARASSFAGITPFAPGDTQQRADEILFKGTGRSTQGKVRRGPFRGKQMILVINPYHNPVGGGSHGDDGIDVYVEEKIGSGNFTVIGKFSTNVARSMAVGYGHYTFVVTGSSGGTVNGQMSTIAWSEDGINWQRVDLGRYGQINAIAVGPRPSDAPPKPPRADEITNGGKTVGGQVPTIPTS